MSQQYIDQLKAKIDAYEALLNGESIQFQHACRTISEERWVTYDPRQHTYGPGEYGGQVFHWRRTPARLRPAVRYAAIGVASTCKDVSDSNCFHLTGAYSSKNGCDLVSEFQSTDNTYRVIGRIRFETDPTTGKVAKVELYE